MTPPYPGNKRGALWTEDKNTLSEWTVDFEFRAGGGDRAGGKLQLWYARDGQQALGTASIYTAGAFDGLALVVDTHGGQQNIRGFLNDGTTDYRSHPNVDALAFGHCHYAYRNLGRPSKITLISGSSGLQVLVDGNPCFNSEKISLPSGYYFGVTAASSESPDSFEVFKFVLKSVIQRRLPEGAVREEPNMKYKHAPQARKPEGATREEPNMAYKQAPQIVDDTPASEFTTSQAQFEDLHSRLHLMSKATTNLFGEITKQTSAQEQRYQEILRQQPTQQTMANLDQRLQNIETMISAMKREIEGTDHKWQFDKLHEKISQTHVGVSEHLPERLRETIANHAPRVGFMITSLILFQCILAVAYVVYKRRRANAPKKYL